MCSYKASPWLPYIHVIRNVHICMHLPRFHQQDTSCLSLIHSPWNVIRVRIISDLIAQMSNPCLFLSGKQNDTTRQLFSRCAASLNEQCTTDLIGCNSLIPRPLLLGESHSQTSITGRVSFPDLHCWESLIPRPPLLGESHSQTLSTVHIGSQGSLIEIKLLTLHRTCMLL